MAENPESLNALVTHHNGNENAVDALRRQVMVHEQANDDKTALDKIVEVVWHKDDQTLADLKALQAKVIQDNKRGDDKAVVGLSTEIKAAVQTDQAAMQQQNSVEFYAGSFLKAVPLFAGKSKLLMAASIGFNALDAVHMKDQGGQVAADLALGGLKGFALKKTFDVLGTKQLSLGAEGSVLSKVSPVVGVGLKGIAIGGLSRLYDTGLNRQNWVNASGEVDPLQAVSMAAKAAVDGRSMALDATLFIGAHGVFTGVAKLGSAAVEASPVLQKFESSALGSFIKDSKMLPSSAMGATFGFSSGAVGEVTRERQSGESLDLGKILKRGTYQAITDAAAGATGATATRMTQIQPNSSSDKVALTRKMGAAFAGDDEVPEDSAGFGHEASDADASHFTYPEASPVAPQDAGDFVHPEASSVSHPEVGAADQTVESVTEVRSDAAQPHKFDAALQPIFEQAVNLAGAAVQPTSGPEDVISFFKFAAGDGQHVRTNMEDVARQANQVGNTAMEALIKHAYETTPETAATLDTGLSLAEAASRHGATEEQDRAFLDYAYGPGKGAEVPLRVAAELSGNTALDARVQEAYAGAHQLQRQPTVQYQINLDNMHPVAADALKNILGNLPEDAESHLLFRQNLHRWLDLVPDHQDVVKQYAQQTRYGVVAAVVDGKLGTDYLSQFPNRSLTNPDLLDRLKGLDQHRSAASTPVADVPPGQAETNPVQGDQPAARNPYQPAIEHLANGKVVNPERLIEEFYGTDGRARQARAYLLSDFIGKMNDQQFHDWYANGLQPANRPDLPAGTTNFGLMRMAGLDVLERPEVVAAFTDPEHAAVDLKTLKDFLSAPPQATTAPPAWQTGFIADRVELATAKLAMAEPVVGEDGQIQPIDPNKVVKEAVPNWFLKGIRDRASTFDRNSGTATYPVDFDDNLAQMLENQRFLDRQNPKFRESTPPSNSFADRVATLEKALDVQKTTTAPELVPQILKLGTADQGAVRGILDKLNLETNAPEYTELLKTVVPKAENIQEVKVLLDAMFFGKKAESNAFKARKNDKPADFAERDRDANKALALTVAHKIVPPSDPESKRVEQIVSGVIDGKIRDPRPMDGPGGPGGPGGAGGRGAAGGGREFRQRANPPRDDRPQRETPTKVVPADATVDVPPVPAREAIEPGNGAEIVPPAAGQNLNRTAADDGVAGETHEHNQSVLPVVPVEVRPAGDGTETVVAALGDGKEIVAAAPGDGKQAVVAATDHGAAAGNGSTANLTDADLTPVVSATGEIDLTHQGHSGGKNLGGELGGDLGEHQGGRHQTGNPTAQEATDHRPAGHEDDERLPATGGSRRGAGAEKDDSSGYADRRRSSKPKGRGRDGDGHRERGGAKADRWQRNLEGDY